MSALLLTHIVGGGIGIGSGALALAVRKGGGVHRASGGVFVIAMSVMAGAATLLALTLPDWANLPGGLFALYLVITGWATLTRNEAFGRLAEQFGLALGGAASALSLLLAFQANASATGLINGKAAPLFAIVAGLAAFAVLLDLMVLRTVELSRRRRLARHIWRMCTALFIGTGSFFLGQQKVMPVWMQDSPVLFVLALGPLAAMLFWLAMTAIGRGALVPSPAMQTGNA